MINPSWIDKAQTLTGTVSLRRRPLPAERIVWQVVGMALFKNEPIWLIVQQLRLSAVHGLAPAPSAALQARLVEALMTALLEQLARVWLDVEPLASARFCGLRSFAVDGVV